jgi:hypothetical protein
MQQRLLAISMFFIVVGGCSGPRSNLDLHHAFFQPHTEIATVPQDFRQARFSEPVDVRGNDGATARLESCAGVEQVDGHSLVPADCATHYYLLQVCRSLQRHLAGKPASRTFFPRELDEPWVRSLPAAADVAFTDEFLEYARGRMLLDEISIDEIRTAPGRVEVRMGKEWLSYSLIGRGDYTGDGIEDLMVSVTFDPQTGTRPTTNMLLLSKRSPDGPIEVVERW